MSQRRLVYPTTMLQKMEQVNRAQKTFSGMNADLPASEIGADELAEIINMTCHGRYMRTRAGSSPILLSPTVNFNMPAVSSAVYKVKKIDAKIYILNDTDQTDALVEGNFIYSDEAGEAFQIPPKTTWGTFTDHEGAWATFDSYRTDSFDADTAAYQFACPYGWTLNRQSNKIVLHAGTKLYYTDSTMTEDWTEITEIASGGSGLDASKSTFENEGSDVIIFNNNGVYRVVLDSAFVYYFQINNGQPTARIFEPTRNVVVKDYGRNRTYTMSRIVGDKVLFNDRIVAGYELEAESAPVKRDVNRKDTSKAYYDSPIGDGFTQYQRLRSNTTEIELSTLVWKTYTSGSFKLTINGVTQEIIRDYSNIENMVDVCAEMQAGARDFFPFCRVEYEADGPRINIYPSDSDGSTIGYLTAATGGTNIAGTLLLGLTEPDGGTGVVGATIEDYNPNSPAVVTGMISPSGKWTHFSIYGSPSIGQIGLNNGNQEDQLVWLADIPVVKILRGSMTSGVVTLVDDIQGFSIYDVGSTFVWTDGTLSTISYLCNSSGTEVKTTTSRYAKTSNESGEDQALGYNSMYFGASKRANFLVQSSGVISKNPVAATDDDFSSGDVGEILFLSNGSTRKIIEFISADSVRVLESDSSFDFTGNALDGSTTSGAWEQITASIDVTRKVTVSYENESTSILTATEGGVFTAADVNSVIYLSDDGGSVYSRKIIAEISGTARVAILPIYGSWVATIHGSVTRSFNDTITDETIINFADDPSFALQTRFFEPLPSSNVGALSRGFAFVCPDAKSKISYCSYTSERRFVLGWYRPDWQVDTAIDDSIVALKSYPDRIVAFGKRATWASNVAAFSKITTEKIGEVVYTVPQFSVIDLKGILHVGAIQDVSLGQSVVMTKDGGTFLFDGKIYSNDLSANKISSLLRAIGTTVISSYDGNGGYMLFGSATPLAYDDECVIDATRADCFRLAIMPNQGYGWTIFGGEGMVFPFQYLGGLSVEDESGLPIQIMADSRTGNIYEISTYTNAAGAKAESELDKGAYYIQSSFKFPEARGTLESFEIEHLETHVYIRPLTDTGTISTDLQINSQMYKDGATAPSARTKNTPNGGDIVFDRKLKGKRLQPEIIFTVGGIRVVSADTFYVTRDTAGATAIAGRSSSESDLQTAYADGVLWITRGSKAKLNRQTGVQATGTFTERVEGLDGVSNSGLYFDGTDFLEVSTVGTLDGDFSIQVGFQFDASAIPAVSTTEVATLDGSEFEGMDVIGNDNTFIALDRTNGRFTFVCDMVICGYLGKSGGWVTSAPAVSAATSMGVYFDIDRSLFLFIIDGVIKGVVDGNVATGAFKTAIPVSYYANVGAYIDCNIADKSIYFVVQTTNDISSIVKGTIDVSGFN